MIMELTGINQTQYLDKVFKYYTYKDGKGQEKSVSLKDSVEISLPSFTVSVGSETYEELKTQIKTMHNGVWNWNSWQNNHQGMENTSYISDETAVPPRGFQYFAGNYSGQSVSDLKESLNKLEMNQYTSNMTLIAAKKGVKMGLGSLLLDNKNFNQNSDKIDDSLYQSGIDFLEKFHIKYGSDRIEILKRGGN